MQDVLEALNRLHEKGVILIGDEFTLPALMVDYRIRSVARDSGDPVKTRQQLQKLGRRLPGYWKIICTVPEQSSGSMASAALSAVFSGRHGKLRTELSGQIVGV